MASVFLSKPKSQLHKVMLVSGKYTHDMHHIIFFFLRWLVILWHFLEDVVVCCSFLIIFKHEILAETNRIWWYTNFKTCIRSKKKSTSKCLLWCFSLSQTEDSIQYQEGPNGIYWFICVLILYSCIDFDIQWTLTIKTIYGTSWNGLNIEVVSILNH